MRLTNLQATIEEVTEACVALLRIDVAEQSSRDRAQRRRRDTESELDRLEALRAVVEQDISAFLDGGADRLRDVADRVADALRSGLRDTRAALQRDLDRANGRDRSPADAAKIERVAGGLIARCDLPDARWRLRWSAGANGAPAFADAVCALPDGVQATFATTIDSGEPWHAPRVDHCVGPLAVLLPDLGRLSLSRYVVCELEQVGDRHVLRLARSARGLDAVEVVIRAPGQPTPTVRRANEPTAISVTPDVAAAFDRLWVHVAAGVLARVRRVDALQLVTLEDSDVRALPRPKVLAAALLASIGALVQEARAHQLALPDDLRGLFSACGLANAEVDEDAPTRRIRIRLPLQAP